MLPLTLHDWLFLSGFGGAAVMLPVALAITFWLFFAFGARMAGLWLLLIGIASVLVAATKIAFLGWGIGIREVDFTGVSGHTMLSSAIFPVMFYLILLPTGRILRGIGVIAGLAVGLLVGLSRLQLQAHSVSEMVVGCMLGALVALSFILTLHNHKPMRSAPYRIAFSLVILAFGLHDFRAPTQHWVTEVALSLSGHERPFIRARWKANHYSTEKTSTPTERRSVGHYGA
jgi:membrane-associated phospholipid phosphatase